MDNTQYTPTVLSLCSGYGGIEIGLERAIGRLNVLAHVEIEAYAAANLVAKMEQGLMAPTPIWTNLKTLPVEPFRDRVDILTGGYPCQPFSHAGKRKGTDDPRHLWPHIRRLVREIRPRLCFFENVEGHISLGLSTVISDLEEDGYRTAWGIFSASEVDAPHHRKRVFILGYASNDGHLASQICKSIKEGNDRSEAGEETASKSQGSSNKYAELENTSRIGRRVGSESWLEILERQAAEDQVEGSSSLANPRRQRQEIEEQQTAGVEQQGQSMADNSSEGLEGLRLHRLRENEEAIGEEKQPIAYTEGSMWPSRPGQPQYDWEEPRTVKSGVGRAANGSSSRVDRLRLLGNGVVPQTAEKAFRVLMNRIGHEE